MSAFSLKLNMFIGCFFRNWKLCTAIVSVLIHCNVVMGNALKSENVRMKVANAFQNPRPGSEGCLLTGVPNGSLSFTANLILLCAKDKLTLEVAVGLGRIGDF